MLAPHVHQHVLQLVRCRNVCRTHAGCAVLVQSMGASQVKRDCTHGRGGGGTGMQVNMQHTVMLAGRIVYIYSTRYTYIHPDRHLKSLQVVRLHISTFKVCIIACVHLYYKVHVYRNLQTLNIFIGTFIHGTCIASKRYNCGFLYMLRVTYIYTVQLVQCYSVRICSYMYISSCCRILTEYRETLVLCLSYCHSCQ